MSWVENKGRWIGLISNESFPLVKIIYSTIRVECAQIVLVLVWRKSIHLTNILAKNDFYIFVPNDRLLTYRHKICSLVTLVQHHASTKLEDSVAFLFRENRRHWTDGQTDGQDATLNVAPWMVALSITFQYTVWVKKSPLRGPDIFYFFHKRLRIFNRFLHTYYSFLSTLDYKFLFNYPRFWWSYAILSATTQFTQYAQNVLHRAKRMRWHVCVSRW